MLFYGLAEVGKQQAPFQGICQLVTLMLQEAEGNWERGVCRALELLGQAEKTCSVHEFSQSKNLSIDHSRKIASDFKLLGVRIQRLEVAEKQALERRCA